MTETSFPKYEIMLILQPDLGVERTTEVLQEMKDLIAEASGKITHEDLWGLRELAYVIKKQRQGYYAVLNFTADPLKVKEFEKQLNIHQGILRYLIQKTPKNYEIKTLAEYEEIAKEDALKAQEEAKAKAEKGGGDSRGGDNRGRNRRFERPETPAPKRSEEKPVKTEKPAVKEEKEEKKPVKKVKKEEPVEETEEKPKAKKQAATLEDVDAKLKSIIDDPDITL
ncbi:MAG: 30S ribosomal protein S6 [Candidatus Gracilibacteria bacterium]